MNENKIFDFMYKLTQKQIDDLNLVDGEFLPDGYVTDGYGNIYKVPTTGITPYMYPDESYVKNTGKYAYNYDWDDNIINVFSVVPNKDTDTDDAYVFEFLVAEPVSVDNFVDNPDYWFSLVIENVQDIIDSAVEDLAVENFNETIKESKKLINSLDSITNDNYFTYKIGFSSVDDYKLGVDDEDAEKILLDYDFYTELYNYVVHVKTIKMEYGYELTIKSPIELSNEDLIDIFDDYKEAIKIKLDNEGYTFN